MWVTSVPFSVHRLVKVVKLVSIGVITVPVPMGVVEFALYEIVADGEAELPPLPVGPTAGVVEVPLNPVVIGAE